MEKWMVYNKKADFQKIGSEFGIDPVIARLIRNRDIQDMKEIRSYLYGTLAEIPSPWKMKDMERAVQILQKKITQKKKIRIIGDYDIDGVTATCILLKGLKRLNANVDTYIPDRVKDGYGMHEQLIDKALEDGIDTILTCDNGIAAAAEIEYAKKEGLTVIVTDHHDIPFRDTEDGRIWIIPKADAVVNPKQNDCLYPNKNICGAVVAWKLIWALYERLGIDSDEIWDFLELAAIATVGDVMDLQGENRIIVKEGLKKLSSTSFEGLKALICVNNLEGAEITAYHVGFVIGPCINASGRLDTAARSLELLLADNMEDAMKLADDLYDLNQSRKAMTEQGKEQAIQSIEENNLGKDRVLVVYLPDCHESLAGIIAGRIREAYNKPVFVLTKGADGVKGSGRSIEAYSMYEELVKCSDLLTQFGGHPMAAGLSMEEKNVELFRRRLNDNCTLTEQDLIPKIMIDVPMPISYLSKKLTEQLKVLEPFGKGNSKPLFAQKNLRAVGIRVFGRNRNVAKMLLIDENGIKMDAVYFGEAQEFVDFVQAHDTISVTYYPEINVFQGRENLQVVIKNYC
ncbi:MULTISPECIES: single-stranded-DNA-specific exonuclease RecJ [Blautia]|jgi:single-stranded-DNA-specific exonuclease|uniref:single-stranded-DNA-specific exonuclease RecJ n=1 Tax=Blautia TaxID=572511 RepID=UPI000E4C83AC|nr:MULTISPECIES: single-stranded-DNA-specific exonuclease RecJ [Blautia]MCB6730958.1 single-stranded-DNA-specific exonuclease RecJ [Blautia obeum]MCB6742034.1 single-stranded-DNA-specific exonuclease RecJ [Blautia sp. 210820-DFI.6.14]MCB6958386.1 single-stranded-DNA-specific exonuclease RecJ [Blautia obeum]MCG4675445.1 single-stranded-DNA-specific exonuclease RecJ [Blautia obeum]MDE8681321.1 single-stranded-DNA-specific exonuclease RecJ [Blautia schinkii]